MKNVIVCSNCGTENAFFKLNCANCKAYIRTRIVNIDLWHTIYLLIESPVIAFQNIIQAEHKNFIIFLSFLIGIKFFLFAAVAASINNYSVNIESYFLSDMLIYIGYSFIILALFPYLMTKLNNLFGLQNRYKDNLAMYIYTFIPVLMSLAILSPVHYALFGKYWFTYNPSPFLIKPAIAWVLSIIEVILVLWSVMLSVTATYAQTRNKVYSFITGVGFWVILILLFFYLPLLPFS